MLTMSGKEDILSTTLSTILKTMCGSCVGMTGGSRPVHLAEISSGASGVRFDSDRRYRRPCLDPPLWRQPIAAGKRRMTAPTEHRTASAADVAYERLRSEIYDGRLMPNERLVEAELSARLKVSRSAVRTALVRLGQDGVVLLTPHRGARVRLVPEAEAVEILQVRTVLEALTARQAAIRATTREVAAMRRVLTQMRQSLEQDDLLAYSAGNARLHAAVIAAARHETAARLIAGLKAQLVRFQYRTTLVPGRPAKSLDEHAAIVAGIAARDPEAAEAAMRLHLTHVEASISNIPRAAGRRPDPVGTTRMA